MSAGSDFRARVKAGKGPYAILRRIARWVMQPTAPRVPSVLKPFFRLLYQLKWGSVTVGRLLLTYFVRQPLFQSRCKIVGRNLMLTGPMPFVVGPVEIELGESVTFGGKVNILSGGPIAKPRLIMKDRSGIGWGSLISVGMEIVIEEDVIISYDCRISDTDGHPKEADLRAAHVPPRAQEIRPVRIGRGAWIGNGAHIMKGVTIGEGAVIGANSVVITDIPPFALALGNPAEVYFKNYGKRSRKPAAVDGLTPPALSGALPNILSGDGVAAVDGHGDAGDPAARRAQ